MPKTADFGIDVIYYPVGFGGVVESGNQANSGRKRDSRRKSGLGEKPVTDGNQIRPAAVILR